MNLENSSLFHDVGRSKTNCFVSAAKVLLNCLLIWSLIIDTAVAQSPQNTAVVAGTPVSYLNCSASGALSNQFMWSFVPAGETIVSQIVFGCSSNPQLPQYGTESTTNSNCNLIIYNASPAVAGMYQCIPGFSAPSSAQFIVLGSDPVCSTTPTNQVSVDQSVEMSCGTTVTGNMLPVMTWSDSTQQLPSPQIINEDYVGSTITVQATIPTVPSYTCSTKFSAPFNFPSGYATNAPTYTSQCNTAGLQVVSK